MDETDSTTAPYNPQCNKQQEPVPQSDCKMDVKQLEPPKPNNSDMDWKWKIREIPSDIFQEVSSTVQKSLVKYTFNGLYMQIS